GIFMEWMEDPYMERIWRIICIEMYHNDQIKEFYEKFIDNAFSFWISNFDFMIKNKLILPLNPEMLAREYLSFHGSAFMDYFIFRYDNTSGSFIQENQDGLDQHTEFIIDAIKPIKEL
ncbi:MAG: TetR/AcrR family transcriptional regulator, partial [Methanobacterium sp.]